MASSARLVALPLCALALVLALIAVTSSGGDMSSELAAKKVASASAKKVKQTVGLQQLELIHVKKCAKEITGSDKPRKLPPAQAKAVNECAKKFMPPTHTKAMLEAAAKKILQAHHQKADEASVHKLMAAQAKKPANSKTAAKARLQKKASAKKA